MLFLLCGHGTLVFYDQIVNSLKLQCHYNLNAQSNALTV